MPFQNRVGSIAASEQGLKAALQAAENSSRLAQQGISALFQSIFEGRRANQEERRLNQNKRALEANIDLREQELDISERESASNIAYRNAVTTKIGKEDAAQDALLSYLDQVPTKPNQTPIDKARIANEMLFAVDPNAAITNMKAFSELRSAEAAARVGETTAELAEGSLKPRLRKEEASAGIAESQQTVAGVQAENAPAVAAEDLAGKQTQRQSLEQEIESRKYTFPEELKRLRAERENIEARTKEITSRVEFISDPEKRKALAAQISSEISDQMEGLGFDNEEELRQSVDDAIVRLAEEEKPIDPSSVRMEVKKFRLIEKGIDEETRGSTRTAKQIAREVAAAGSFQPEQQRRIGDVVDRAISVAAERSGTRTTLRQASQIAQSIRDVKFSDILTGYADAVASLEGDAVPPDAVSKSLRDKLQTKLLRVLKKYVDVSEDGTDIVPKESVPIGYAEASRSAGGTRIVQNTGPFRPEEFQALRSLLFDVLQLDIDTIKSTMRLSP